MRRGVSLVLAGSPMNEDLPIVFFVFTSTRMWIVMVIYVGWLDYGRGWFMVVAVIRSGSLLLPVVGGFGRWWEVVVRGDVGNAHARGGLVISFTNRSRTEVECACFTDTTGGRNCRRVSTVFARATSRRGRRTGHVFG